MKPMTHEERLETNLSYWRGRALTSEAQQAKTGIWLIVISLIAAVTVIAFIAGSIVK